MRPPVVRAVSDDWAHGGLTEESRGQKDTLKGTLRDETQAR